MGQLFGKTKKKEVSRVTEQDRAVLQLKQQRDKLKQYQKKINVQLENERKLAKELLGKGKKEKALRLLRKKKYQESLLQKTDGQLENLDKLVQDIEFAQVEAKVLEGLAAGNEALKKMHQLVSIEDAEKIMDETQEAVAYQQEIDDILAGGLTQQDEDDVLAELESIGKEQLRDVPETMEADIQLPDVPTNAPEKVRVQERQERQAVAVS